MKRAFALMVAGLALAACDDSPAGGADPAKGANAQRYARDRQQCQAQADQQMKTRQRVDDSRRATFDDNQDRFGRSALPDTMANYGEAKSADRILERCLQSRGWAQDQKSWWQKITG